MLRASALARIMACPSSEALPHIQDVTTKDAERGTHLHRYIETRGSLDGIPEQYHEECKLLPLEKLPVGEHEVAMAYDVASDKARRVTKDGKDYTDLGPFEIGCTVDVMRADDDRVFIADYKSGFRSVAHAAKNPQLLLGALCAARIHGADEAEVQVIYISDPSNPFLCKPAVIDLFDLEMFAKRLRQLHSQVAELHGKAGRGESLPVVEGEHCRYCPAITSCPAKAALIHDMEADNGLPMQVELSWRGGLTPSNARQAYETYQKCKMLTNRMGQILHAYAKQEPIDLGDGRVFGERTKQGREKLDGGVAWRILKERYGLHVAEKACGYTVTKKGLRSALREVCSDGIGKAEKDVIQEIRDAGGSERKETTTVEEFTR